MTDTDSTLRNEVAEALRWVPIGPFGPNARETINAGGTTFLNGSEREALADALLPLLARVREEGEARVRERLVRMSNNLDSHRYFAGAGWPEILRTAAGLLAEPNGDGSDG